MAEHFHYIDRSTKSDFREQAYAFEQLNDDKFRISVAVLDLSLLSLHSEITNVSMFMENVEAICRIGHQNNRYRKIEQHHHLMINDYQSGNKKLFIDKGGLYNNHIVYSTEVDFSLVGNGRNLCNAISNLKIEEKKHIICNLTSSFSDYGKTDLQTPGLDDALIFYDNCHNVDHLTKKYHKMLKNNNNQASSTGCFLTWAAGTIIKESFAWQDINNKKLNLVATRYDLDRKPSFVPIRSAFESKGHVYYAPLTNPIYDPISALNRIQISSFYNQGKSELGSKEIVRLVDKLHKYRDNYQGTYQEYPPKASQKPPSLDYVRPYQSSQFKRSG